MTEYALYVESGPRMKTTMVHVLDLLGCVANGQTTEAALEATPNEIRHYLRFLARHGEKVNPDAEFTVRIVQHVMEGSWIGYGDPAPGFAPDFEALTPEDERTYRRRFQWLGEELVALVRSLSAKLLTAKPGKGRALIDIAKHAVMPEPEYMRASGIGKPEGTKETLAAVEAADADELADAIAALWRLLDSHLDAITPEVRKGQVQRGEKLWTARRGFRRLLEHPWEHLREIERRLA